MTRLDYALLYLRRGWKPVPIPKGQKGPLLKEWQNLRITETDAPKYFRGGGNIGIILGPPSGGLADIDLDCPEAMLFAQGLLPPTKSIFGRISKPHSHLLYKVSGPAPSLHFKDPVTGDTLLELRADGGKQTVFPSSIHPSGEMIEWNCDGDPAVVDYSILRKAAHRIAARCLITRYLPKVTNIAEVADALPGIDPRVAERISEWLELPKPIAETKHPSTIKHSRYPSPQSIPEHLRGREQGDFANRELYVFARNDLDDCVRELKNRRKPGRANLLYKRSIQMGVLIAQGHIDHAEVSDALYEASVSNGLVGENGKDDVHRNIKGGFEYGASKAQEAPSERRDIGDGQGNRDGGRGASESGASDNADGSKSSFGKSQSSSEENMFGKKPPLPRLEIISMDEVEGQNIDFVWPNRLALGKHSALAGIGGKGKSQVLYSVCAIITTGGLWPCGEGSAPQGSVVLLSAEDDIADMMQPRLIGAGANLKRVKAIKAVIEGSGRKKQFNLLADLDALYQACRELGDVAMVGIDPLGSYLGGELDTHRDAALRHALDPISEMASAARCSVFSIMHFNKAASMKAAMDRVMGGAGFVNAPRCALGLLVDPDDENKRVLLGLKTNIGPMPQGLRMHLEMANAGIDRRTGLPIRATHVVWDGPTDLTADAVVAMTNERETPKLDEAIAFLQSELKDGPRPVEGVKSHAAALGISVATLKRAREQIGAIARQIKGSPHGGWEYQLPVSGA